MRRLAALRLLAALATLGPFAAAQATVWAPIGGSPHATAAAGAGVRPVQAAPGGRHDAPSDGRAPAANVPAGPASTADELSASRVAAPDGALPRSQTWALVGGGLLGVCMIARRQRRHG